MDQKQTKASSEADAFIGIDIDIEPPPDAAAARNRRKRGARRSTKRGAPSSSPLSPPSSTKNNNGAPPPSRRKRPRQSSTAANANANAGTAAASTSDAKRPKRPRPPPPPPSALVSLLRNDAAVRSYFRSLQENLDYDVDKWKHEAASWKAAAAAADKAPESNARRQRPQRKRQQQRTVRKKAVRVSNNNCKGGGGAATTGRTKRSGKPESKNDDAAAEPGRKIDDAAEEGDEGAAIPITDEALFGDLSSDDDDDDDDDDDGGCSVQQNNIGPCDEAGDAKSPLSGSAEMNVAGVGRRHDEEVEERHSHVLEKLREAKKCLDALGVRLVEVEVTTTTTMAHPPQITTEDAELGTNDANDPHQTAAEQHGTGHRDAALPTVVVERVLHRQSDEKVAAEMMASFKTLIKCSSYMFGTTSRANNTKDAAAQEEQTYDLPENDDGDGSQQEGMTEQNAPQELSNEELVRRCKLRRRYHPFCRDGRLHTPTVYYSNSADGRCVGSDGDDDGEGMPQHPASLGLKRLVTVLSIMDTYCSEDLEDDDWNAIFDSDLHQTPPDEGTSILRAGLRSRSRLARRVLSSLSVEATRAWALADRATALETISVHFHPADALDADDPEIIPRDDDTFYNSEKSYNRMVDLEERIGHARIASLLHRSRGEGGHAARLVAGYVVSCAPSMGGGGSRGAAAEAYPKLPPALSMCVLEALLAPEGYVPINVEGNEAKDENDVDNDNDISWASASKGGWFCKCVRQIFSGARSSGEDDGAISSLLRALAYPVHVAASVWRERSFCSDDRVRDVSAVELAAYDRLRKLEDGTWPGACDPGLETMDFDRIARVGNEILSSAMAMSSASTGHEARAAAGISCAVALLTLGDADRVIRLCETILASATSKSDRRSDGKTSSNGAKGKGGGSLYYMLPICCSAYATIARRRWDTIKLGDAAGGRRTASAFTVRDEFTSILDSVMRRAGRDNWRLIDIGIQCCVILGDGRRLQRLAMRAAPNLTRSIVSKETDKGSGGAGARPESLAMSRAMTSLMDAAEAPTIRVINLERRPDRMLDFMACAVGREQLMVVSGPCARLRRKALIAARHHSKTSFIGSPDGKNVDKGGREDDSDPDDGRHFAFDGRCGRDELEEQLQWRLEGKGTLQDFVRAKWRPSELKAFDRNARDGFELVPTSMTERAWMGVESTLSEMGSGRTEYDHEWYQKKLLRTFQISGFARGPALLPANDDCMDPVPVCVILEDDAVLVDRFAERLASLLEELPRDFHMCSLGYSRPRAAPMAEYSAQLGIPSCLWYLTGYVLSLEGARHLIKSLPVTGPVDSWIGLKMCGNWDNKFGDLMGVGKYTKAKAKLPSRKDLAKIMKFRAFAALVPLCAQKVGTSTTPALTRGGWRDKDTDITYSGR